MCIPCQGRGFFLSVSQRRRNKRSEIADPKYFYSLVIFLLFLMVRQSFDP